MAIERWRARSGPAIARWLDAIGQLEALAAFAAFAGEHPELPFPELTGARVFAARGLRHPLLGARAVPNDVALGGERPLLVVSGSNMSGKSTLLRAAGLNAVLAWAGAPVCAGSLTLGPFAVGASLRNVDSVQEGKSRFYAEISRLRQIMDLTRGPRPVLFLLDELLSGTNSHDRRIGAEAVIRGLLARGAAGMVTTHDLALTAIAPAEANVHFADELVNGEIRFDYKLKPGVVQRSNALELMRSVGLEVPE
jgi:DNA mismatch repair ATPase MutS